MILMTDILIPNLKNFDKKLKHIIADGKDDFYVVADFDRTLTRAFVEGQKSHVVIAQLRNNGVLSPEYTAKAFALYDHYYPIEMDMNIPRDQKILAMHEWRWKHFQLMIKYGLTKKIMDDVVAQRAIKFREGAFDFFDILHRHNIPLLIVSGSIGDMIVQYIAQEGRLYDNVHIVSNSFIYNETGQMIGVKEPIVHSLNKSSVIFPQFSFYPKIEKRKNILLIGDGVEDIQMIADLDYKHLLKIGFCNEDTPSRIEQFSQAFDVVITGDGSMDWVNELIKKISF